MTSEWQSGIARCECTVCVASGGKLLSMKQRKRHRQQALDLKLVGVRGSVGGVSSFASLTEVKNAGSEQENDVDDVQYPEPQLAEGMPMPQCK